MPVDFTHKEGGVKGRGGVPSPYLNVREIAAELQLDDVKRVYGFLQRTGCQILRRGRCILVERGELRRVWAEHSPAAKARRRELLRLRAIVTRPTLNATARGQLAVTIADLESEAITKKGGA